MAAVKEIGGIAGIERQSLESGKRFKYCGSPFPAVSNQIGDAEGAVPIRVRIHWAWSPTGKVEVAVTGLRGHISPWIKAFVTFRRSKGCTVKLSFGGQRLLCPAGIRFRFGVTDVHGPGRLKWNIREHRSQHPIAGLVFPE